MFHLYSANREAYMERYHQRSLIETAFSMIKAKFGGHIRGKTDTAMINECLCKIVCHNLCCLIMAQIELGIDPVLSEDEPVKEVVAIQPVAVLVEAPKETVAVAPLPDDFDMSDFRFSD